jgi:hypothetical protein
MRNPTQVSNCVSKIVRMSESLYAARNSSWSTYFHVRDISRTNSGSNVTSSSQTSLVHARNAWTRWWLRTLTETYARLRSASDSNMSNSSSPPWMFVTLTAGKFFWVLYRALNMAVTTRSKALVNTASSRGLWSSNGLVLANLYTEQYMLTTQSHIIPMYSFCSSTIACIAVMSMVDVTFNADVDSISVFKLVTNGVSAYSTRSGTKYVKDKSRFSKDFLRNPCEDTGEYVWASDASIE